jgi:hypothetical protein
MKPKTEIINNKIVNWVEQLACFLKTGDVFRKPRGLTKYKFKELVADQHEVICENLDTNTAEAIYSNSPVFKLMMI